MSFRSNTTYENDAYKYDSLCLHILSDDNKKKKSNTMGTAYCKDGIELQDGIIVATKNVQNDDHLYKVLLTMHRAVKGFISSATVAFESASNLSYKIATKVKKGLSCVILVCNMTFSLHDGENKRKHNWFIMDLPGIEDAKKALLRPTDIPEGVHRSWA